MKINVQALLDQRKAALDEAKSLVEKAELENRDLNADEEKRYTELMAKTKDLEKRAKRLQEVTPPEPPAQSTVTPPAGGRPEGRFSAPSIQTSERPRYSLLRALRLASERRTLDGLEGEVSQELARRAGKQPQGFFMPMDFADPFEQRQLDLERRDLNLTTGSGAKPTIVDASSFIGILRNRALVQTLGARILTGLTGDLSIPKQTAASTAYWFDSESASVTESQQTIGQVGLAPKTLGAMTDISRKFLLQSSLDAEQFVRNDLAEVLALELDRTVINGSGSGAEPQGILQNSSIGTIAMGTNGLAPDWASVVALETNVSVANADVGNLAYLTNAKVRGKMKTTAKVSGQAIFLMDDDGKLNGYTCGVSNQVPSNLTKGTSSGVCSAAIFGDWSSVLIGLWTGLDVLVDPYTGGASGTLRIRLLQDADVKFRRTESFQKIVDYLTT